MKHAPNRLTIMAATMSAAISPQALAGPGTVNGQPTYFANSPILAKFKDTLPGLSALPLGPGYGPNNLGQYLPVASALPGISTADILSYPGSDYFELAVVDYTEQMHRDLKNPDGTAHPTLLRGYVQIDRAMTNRGYDLAAGSVVANPVKSPNSAGHKLTNPDGSPILIPLEDAKHNIVHANGKPVMVQAYAFDKPHYLGPVIVAMKDRATRIKFNNLIKAGSAKLTNGKVAVDTDRNGDLFIPTDHTLAGTELIPDPTSPTGFSNVHFRENRAILHLHGGSTPWISDGTPHQWIVPAEDELLFKNGGTDAAGHVIPPLPDYARGMSTQNVPDMPDAGPGAVTYYWTNRDSGRLMMYHDHTSGTTRLNPYVGEAAGFVIADDKENALMRDVLGLNVATPSVVDIVAAEGIPLVFQDRSWVPNDIATQDSLWDQNAWGKPGDLWFPHVYETAGPNPAGRWDWGPDFPEWPGSLSTNRMRDAQGNWNDNLPTGAYGDVTHVPEAFMDTPVVNGTAYPTLTVEPKAYRFRVLSVGNDRAFNLGLYVAVDANGNPCDGTTIPVPEATQIACTEVKMVPFDTTAAGAPPFPSYWGTPDISNGEVRSIALVDKGAGYTHPLVMIQDAAGGTGSGATATATRDANGSITGIALASAGSGYSQQASASVCEEDPNSPGSCLANLPAGVTGATAKLTVNPVNNVDAGLHLGGVPDPQTAGPDIVQIGTEGGLFAKPVTIPSTITNYEEVIDGLNSGSLNLPLLAVKERGLHLAPAERADVIIDFSQYAGKTLILYNDSPAPSPGPDPRYDYYTDDLDRTAEGGAPTTLAGYGPNTRTIMQIKVGTQVTGNNTANWQTKLNAGLASAVDGTTAAPGPQDPLLTAPLAINGSDVQFTANGTLVTLTDPLDPIKKTTLTAKEKTIFEDFDFKGRITATLGTWTPGNSAAAGTQQPQGYINPNTDTFPDGDLQGLDNGEVQVWRITHNGVDMHPLHWHLVNLQILGRVGWDGQFRAPHPTEQGWKETVEIVPMMDTLVAVKAKNPKLPFGLPRSVRLLDPAQPYGNNLFFTQVDPITGAPANFTNQYADFNWEYVWHCHILGHEENDLMRPLVLDFIAAKPDMPAIDTTTSSATTLAGAVNLKWTDPTPGWNGTAASPALAALAQDYTGAANPASGDVEIDPVKRKQNEIGFRVERAPVVNDVIGTYAPLAAGKATYTKGVADALTGKFGLNSQGDKTKVATFDVNAIANATSYTDSSIPPTGDFSYRVVAVNAAVDTTGNWVGEQMSAPVTVAGLPDAPANLMATTAGATAIDLSWGDVGNDNGYVASSDGVSETVLKNVTSVQLSGLEPNTLHTLSVAATNAAGNGAAASVQQWTDASPVSSVAAGNPTSSGLTLNWFDPNPGTTTATVTVTPAGTVGTISCTADSYSTPISALAANTAYSFGVAVKGGSGVATAATVGSGTTTAAPVTALSVPSVTDSAVNLSWSNANPGATSVTIEVLDANGTPVAGASAAITGNTAVVSGLTVNTAYQLVVRVTGLNGQASASTTVPATTLAPVSGLTSAYAPVTRKVTLNWTDTPLETGYVVQRQVGTIAALTGAVTWGAATPVNLVANTVTWTSPALTANALYKFSVYPVNGAIPGPAATVVMASTAVANLIPSAPSQPQVTQGAAGSRQLKVQWQASASTGVTTGYEVQRCVGAAAACKLATAVWGAANPPGTSGWNSTKATDSGLAIGTTYSYRVRAANALIPGLWSNWSGVQAAKAR